MTDHVLNIVITVPHAQPPTPANVETANYMTGDHAYDFAAPTAATLLHKWYQSHPESGGHSTLCLTNINRCELDMNRPWARHASASAQQWRDNIRSIVAPLARDTARPTLVVDVHSYPRDYVGFSGIDVAVLVPKWPSAPHIQLATDMASQLVSDHIRVGVVYSPGMCDVIHEYAKYNNVIATMFEISEALTPPQQTKLMAVVGAQLLQLSKYGDQQRATSVPCYYVDPDTPQARSRIHGDASLSPITSTSGHVCANCGRKAVQWCSACQSVCFCADTLCQQRLWSAPFQHWVVCTLISQAQPKRSLEAKHVGWFGETHDIARCLCGENAQFKCNCCNQAFCTLTCRHWADHLSRHTQQNSTKSII
jgi:hypothetical protein